MAEAARERAPRTGSLPPSEGLRASETAGDRRLGHVGGQKRCQHRVNSRWRSVVSAPTIVPSINANWVHAAKHIATLFPAGTFLSGEAMELRCFRDRKVGPRRFFGDHVSLILSAMKWTSEWDVYVGVGTRRCPAGGTIADCPHKSPGAKDHVARVRAAWVEIDLGKPYEALEQILDAVDKAGLNPDLLVASGGGLHAYFVLEEPTTDFVRLERLNRRLVKAVGHDAAIDASRVLRLAGTLNHKTTPPQPALILRREVL